MNTTVTTTYGRLRGALGTVPATVLAADLVGKDSGTPNHWYFSWEGFSFPYLTEDRDYTNRRAFLISPTEGKIEITEGLPLLAALEIAEKLSGQKSPEKALQRYGDLDLPLWRIVHEDELALEVAKAAVAELATRVATRKQERAEMSVLFRIWAVQNEMEHLVKDDRLVVTTTELTTLPRRVQEDLLALMVSGAQVVINQSAGSPEPEWLPKGSIGALKRIIGIEGFAGRQRDLLDTKKWDKVRKDLVTLVESPVRWVSEGPNRDARRHRALGIPDQFLVGGQEVGNGDEMVERTLRLRSHLDEYSDDELVAELRTLAIWGRILCVRLPHKQQSRVYEALQIARPTANQPA